MACSGAPGLTLLLWSAVGFDWLPSRGGGRAEEALLSLPLAVAELRLQALVLLQQLIDLALFLSTTLAEGAAYGHCSASPVVALVSASAVHSRCCTFRQRG